MSCQCPKCHTKPQHITLREDAPTSGTLDPMSGLHPEAPFHDAPISAVEDRVGVVQAVPFSSDGSSSAAIQAPAAAEEPSTFDSRISSTATQAVLSPSGEETPGVGESSSSAAHSTNAFDNASPEDIATYGRISFEGSCDFFLAPSTSKAIIAYVLHLIRVPFPLRNHL